jgi:hypothetical protein
MRIMKKIFLIILSLAVFSACERKIDKYPVSSGSADFSKFITIGNSLFAGYADGALYNYGQKTSMVNILAGQLQLAGAGSFVQPLVNSEYGIDFPGFHPKLILQPKADCQGTVGLSAVYATGALAPFQPVGYAVNNFGVPGAKSFHILAPHYGDPAGLYAVPPTANPYYVRFAQTPASTVLGDAMSASPTFFALWLGDNDVLSYALSGGTADTITSPLYFRNVMMGILSTLTNNGAGAKGVIATIPDITSIPYFTTIPYNGLYLARQTLVDSINYAMSLYQLPFNYHVGYNPFLVQDTSSVYGMRQMVQGEMVLLSVPQDSLKCGGWGIISPWSHMPAPIPKQFVLSTTDVTTIQTTTVEYNQAIIGLSSTFNLALVDMNYKMQQLSKGISWNGVTLNAVYVTGGAFSLDGIHLCPRGNALAANYFIDAINEKYGSHIPHVDITKYPGVMFP